MEGREIVLCPGRKRKSLASVSVDCHMHVQLSCLFVCVFVFLSPVCMPIYVCLSVCHIRVQRACLFICLSFCRLFVGLYHTMSVCVRLSVSHIQCTVHDCSSVYLFVCLSVVCFYVSVCPSVCLSHLRPILAHLHLMSVTYLCSVHPSGLLSVFLSSLCVRLFLSFVCISVYVRLSVCLSVTFMSHACLSVVYLSVVCLYARLCLSITFMFIGDVCDCT